MLHLKRHRYYKSCNQVIISKPKHVLEYLGIDIKSMNSAGYLVARCPIHKDGLEHNPSLNIHHEDGHYRCHACGIAGASIVKFYMEVTGKTWAESLSDLRSRL